MRIIRIKENKELMAISKELNKNLPKDYKVKNRVYGSKAKLVFFIKRKDKKVKRIRRSIIVNLESGEVNFPKTVLNRY